MLKKVFSYFWSGIFTQNLKKQVDLVEAVGVFSLVLFVLLAAAAFSYKITVSVPAEGVLLKPGMEKGIVAATVSSEHAEKLQLNQKADLVFIFGNKKIRGRGKITEIGPWVKNYGLPVKIQILSGLRALEKTGRTPEKITVRIKVEKTKLADLLVTTE